MIQNVRSWSRSRRRLAALAWAGGLLLVVACGYGRFLTFGNLPEEPTRYTLEVKAGEVTTVWEYTSERADEPNSPENQVCLHEFANRPSEGECRPEPLIFLKYDLGLNLDNTVDAGAPHRITVTGYYEDRLADVPEVIDMAVEASFDSGSTWRHVTTVAAGRNTFAATITHPWGTEAVALRVSAADSDGNTVVQTIPEAYRLHAPPAAPQAPRFPE